MKPQPNTEKNQNKKMPRDNQRPDDHAKFDQPKGGGDGLPQSPDRDHVDGHPREQRETERDMQPRRQPD